MIYVPNTSRAGIAILICMVAIANLNYFQPHKNQVLFWLTQVSFVTTLSKYVVALLLSSVQVNEERVFIGKLLIGLDIFFMSCSVLAIGLSLFLLHSKVVAINKREKRKEIHSVKVTPTGKKTMHDNSSSKDTEVVNYEALEKANTIQSEFDEDEKNRKTEEKEQQKIQRRSTQMRVEARSKVRQAKALHAVPVFAELPPAGIDSILSLTTFKNARKGDVLFSQGERAKELYILASGQCRVQVQDDQEQRQVGTLRELDFFGESALLDGRNGEQKRNATVVVESETARLLMLSKINFDMLVGEGILPKEVRSAVEEVGRTRNDRTEVEMNIKAWTIK